jgi:hypothetical protein
LTRRMLDTLQTPPKKQAKVDKLKAAAQRRERQRNIKGESSGSSPVAIRMTLTALPITSAGSLLALRAGRHRRTSE